MKKKMFLSNFHFHFIKEKIQVYLKKKYILNQNLIVVCVCDRNSVYSKLHIKTDCAKK